MSTIATMAVELTADTGKFQKDIEGSTEDIEEFEESTEDASSSLDSFISVGKKAAAGFTALTAAIGETVRRTANFAKEMEMMAGAADVSVESFQELNFAFNQMNLDTDDVSEALVEVNRVMGEAARGETDMQRRLEDLGFSMNELSELETEEAFIRMVNSLADMESQAEKTAISGKLFGEDVSRRLLPAIEGGSSELDEMREQAEELGIVMDRDTIRRFSNFRDEFRATKASLMGGIRMLAAEFLPIMSNVNDRIQDMTGFFANLNDKTRQNIARWTLIVGGILGFVTAVAVGVKAIQLISGAFTIFGTVMSTIFGILSSLAIYVLLPIASIALLRKAWEENWFGIRDITKNVWNNHIKPSIDSMIDSLSDLKNWFLESEIGQAVTEFWNELNDIWTDEKSDFSTKLAETIDVTIDFAVTIGNWVWEKTKEAYSNLGELIRATWDYWVEGDETAFKDLEISISDIAIVGLSFVAAVKAATVISGIVSALGGLSGISAAGGTAIALAKGAGFAIASITTTVAAGAFTVVTKGATILAGIGQALAGAISGAKYLGLGALGVKLAIPVTIGLSASFFLEKLEEPTGDLMQKFAEESPFMSPLRWLNNMMEGQDSSRDAFTPPGFAAGGLISGKGTGTSDSIMARLSDGEFVINAKATEQFLPLLQAINSGSMPKFKDGGAVGKASSAVGGLFADSGFQEQVGSMDDMIETMAEGLESVLKGIQTVAEMILDGIMLLAEDFLGEERAAELSERLDRIKESAASAIEGLFDFSDSVTDTGGEDGEKGSTEIITLMDRIKNLRDTIAGFIPTWSELKEGVETGWNAIQSFFTNAETRAKVFDTSMGTITSGLKSVGEMALSQGGGAGQGLMQMASGDFSGGIMSMIQQSGTFQKTMKEIGPVLSEIANIVGEVFAPILQLLKPILENVAEGFRTVGIIVLEIALRIIEAWNLVASGIETVINGIIDMINSINIMGWSPDIGHVGLQIDTDSIEDSLDELKDHNEDTADNTEEMAEAMRNVPQMLPTQMIRQDIGAGDIPSAQVGAEVTRSGMVNVHAGETITPGGKESKGTVINIQGDVYGWNDFKRKVNQAFDQRETNNRLATQGSTGRGVR